VNRGQGEIRDGRWPDTGGSRAITAAAYLVLFLLGAVEGLIGTFEYSRGPTPLAAACFAVAILVTCVLGSWGMRAAPGGVLPAAGWFVVAITLSTVTNDGSVLVADTTAGKWFLYGGAVCAAGGALISFALWARPRAGDRPSR
jgi:hypothetical protein